MQFTKYKLHLIKYSCSPGLVVAVLLAIGCGSSRKQTLLSYEGEMKRAELALQEGRIIEARKRAVKALEMQPQRIEAQKLIAKVMDREIVQEKLAQQNILPEELTPKEKKNQIKTWLERSRSLLQVNQFEEALAAAEQVFRLDPDHLEASRLIDEIKDKAQKQGRADSLFLQRMYQQEIEDRIRRYIKQAEVWLQEKKWGAARFTIEKILVLDPKNPEGRRLLASLNEKRETF